MSMYVSMHIVWINSSYILYIASINTPIGFANSGYGLNNVYSRRFVTGYMSPTIIRSRVGLTHVGEWFSLIDPF